MLRIFDGGCPGSRTWDGEANHTVSRLYVFITVFKLQKKYFFLRQSNKKAEVISPG